MYGNGKTEGRGERRFHIVVDCEDAAMALALSRDLGIPVEAFVRGWDCSPAGQNFLWVELGRHPNDSDGPNIVNVLLPMLPDDRGRPTELRSGLKRRKPHVEAQRSPEGQETPVGS